MPGPDQPLLKPQTPEALGEGRLGDPPRSAEAGAQAGSGAVWGSLDG